MIVIFFLLFCGITGEIRCKCACVWAKRLRKEFIVSDTWRGMRYFFDSQLLFRISV